MRSPPRFALLPGHLAARWSWVTCLCLALSSTGCATLARSSRPAIDPPPAALSAPCHAGPDYPQGASAPLREVIDVVAARETAAADCRARHAALVSAWPR